MFDNRIDLIDQAAFLELRATGQTTLIQFTWIYDRPIDMDALRRFHYYLGRGLLGRLIERSPLPFARDRWVASEGWRDFDVATRSCARADVGGWADERARVPVDPESGPGWHLGVVSLESGGSAISLVVSHCVADGVGVALALAEAAEGRARDLGYPRPRSRARLRALFDDARQTAQGVPDAARAIVATAVLAARRRHRLAAPSDVGPTSARGPAGGVIPNLPSLTVYIDLAAWDARAKMLGGTRNSLFGAFAARVATRLGRIRNSDGAVTLAIPVSERTDHDTRANALTSLTITVDPARAVQDLSEVRDKTKRGLRLLQREPNELLCALPLTPFTPKRLARRLTGLAYGDADLPVGCSNLGELDAAVNRPDGSDADYASMRLVKPWVNEMDLERAQGQLFLCAIQLGGKISINVVAHQPGRAISKHDLWGLITGALVDLDLPALVQ